MNETYVATAEFDEVVERAARVSTTARTPAWHVLWTQSNCEQLVANQLPSKGLLVLSVELLRRSVAVEVDCTFATPA